MSAKVHLELAEFGDHSHRRLAVQLLGAALIADPFWPWPLFQLAEFVASQTAGARETFVAELDPGSLPPKLLSALTDGDETAFWDEAARRVLSNKEFLRKRLGGRVGAWDLVYVLDDPHRLLSETFVFKQTTAANASRDFGSNSKLRRFLRDRGAPITFTLPRPLRITPVARPEANDAVMYLMRKVRGRQLAQLVIDYRRGRGGNPIEHFRRAARFLAYFHAWGFTDGVTLRASPATFPPSLRTSLPSVVVDALWSDGMGPVPLLRKKDAHPENWLLGTANEIVMLDLEANAVLPPGLDLAQLLDDYPLFSNDQAGWSDRLTLLREYRIQLEDLGVPIEISDEALATWYATFALSRCEFGIRRLRKSPGTFAVGSSSSALRAGELRSSHYYALIELLQNVGPTAALRAGATAVRASLG